jgi:Protein of unknown function (DUF4199)
MTMRKTVLTFGFISGAVSSVMMLLTLPFIDTIGFDHGEILGYTLIIASLLPVYFGIRSYRDNVAGGTVTFGRALLVGLLISAISCLCYVITWEFIYFKLAPDFGEKFSAYAIEKVRKSGGSPQAIAETTQQMKMFKEMYDRPLVNAAITFLEPFPIGVVVSAISAAVLRRRARPV